MRIAVQRKIAIWLFFGQKCFPMSKFQSIFLTIESDKGWRTCISCKRTFRRHRFGANDRQRMDQIIFEEIEYGEDQENYKPTAAKKKRIDYCEIQRFTDEQQFEKWVGTTSWARHSENILVMCLACRKSRAWSNARTKKYQNSQHYRNWSAPFCRSFQRKAMIRTRQFWLSIAQSRTTKRPEVIKRGCRCEGDLVKRFKKEQIKPWEKAKCVIKGAVLAILWALFILLAYKVSQLEQHFEEYDPYKILQLDAEADVSEIKKYRELSKLHHPDRPGGDAVLFDNIVKAYKALTDDESRENWRLYGNPDGPKATTFGIALPKWIVSEQYGGWVLGFYALIFMIILPVSVGLWWYNSIKYSADKVLLETTRLYYYFMGKTPNMEINNWPERLPHRRSEFTEVKRPSFAELI